MQAIPAPLGHLLPAIRVILPPTKVLGGTPLAGGIHCTGKCLSLLWRQQAKPSNLLKPDSLARVDKLPRGNSSVTTPLGELNEWEIFEANWTDHTLSDLIHARMEGNGVQINSRAQRCHLVSSNLCLNGMFV